eukprot:jgi/Psemu1/34002/gm1.34002_g
MKSFKARTKGSLIPSTWKLNLPVVCVEWNPRDPSRDWFQCHTGFCGYMNICLSGYLESSHEEVDTPLACIAEYAQERAVDEFNSFMQANYRNFASRYRCRGRSVDDINDNFNEMSIKEDAAQAVAWAATWAAQEAEVQEAAVAPEVEVWTLESNAKAAAADLRNVEEALAAVLPCDSEWSNS